MIVKTLDRLIFLANNKKSVLVSLGRNCKKKIPAAFAQNWSGRYLFNKMSKSEIEAEDINDIDA